MSYDFKSKKHLILNIKRNDFTEIRSGRKTINKSLSRLKDIFKNENFFDII